MRSAAAAAIPFYAIEELAEAEALGPELVDELVRDIAQSVAELPRPKARLREFAAASPAAARTAAVEWLRDFAAHGPLELENIRTLARGDGFVAAVTYRAIDGPAEDEAAAAPVAGDERAAERDDAGGAAPAEPGLSSCEPAEAAAQLFAFEPPAVPKLPPVTPLQVGGQA